MWSIETGKIEHEPREETTFEQSDKETTYEQAAIGFGLWLADTDDSPKHHHDRQLDLWANFLEH